MDIDCELHSKSPIKASHEDAPGPWDRDASQLTHLGKKAVLKVSAGTFAVSLLK